MTLQTKNQMKKLIYLILSVLFIPSLAAQKNCCPDFRLITDVTECSVKQGSGDPKGGDQGHEKEMIACRNATQNFMVLPHKTGFNYSWSVTGGVALTPVGSAIKIKWGNGNSGAITVYIQSVDGLCRDTIRAFVKIVDSPVAGFDFSPVSPVCLNQSVNFNNSSSGATSYYWDFGDGFGSTQTNPTHAYATPGTYTVTLTAYGKPVSIKPTENPNGSEQERDCGCRDVITKTIVVNAERGLTIESACKEMLCLGDTASYCTPNDCDSYSWVVTGGSIIGTANGACVSVVWDGSYPATVSLKGDCKSACGDSASIQVPVLYPSMPVTGSVKVCKNEFSNYSLPAMPGTFYQWSVTGGNYIIGPSQNTASINIKWGPTVGNYTIKCTYKNPNTGCEGSATLNVDVVPPFKLTGQQKYCVGNAFGFSATGNATWNIKPSFGFSPATFPVGNNISGTWTKPGTYTVIATTTTPASFCNTIDSLQILVVDTPKLAPIKGSSLICPGGNSVYSAASSVAGGYFSWAISGGAILSYMGAYGDSVMINWDNAGPYKVEVSHYADGCQSKPVSLVVVPYSKPIISGGATACMDNTAVYTITSPAPPGGYAWSLSNGLGTIVSPQGKDTVTILWHGSNAINTCVLKLTTCGGVDSLLITINKPAPLSISKSGALCGSGGVTLTASIAGASNYNWSLNNNALGANAQSINAVQAGVYKLEIVDANGCVSKASYVLLEEKLNVSAALSTQDKTYWGCEETVNTTLHAIPSAPGYCYQWFKSLNANTVGTPLLGATSSVYTATSAGYYWCAISLCNTSCVAYTDTIRIIKLDCGPCDGDDNYTVSFTNSSCNPMNFTASASPAAALSSVHWYFGDGAEGYGVNVTHQYRDTATYKVCAVFSKPGYCPKEYCKDISINIAANFKAAANCDKVTYTNLSKSKSPITSYNWTFPGGTPSSFAGANPPVITYASGGLQTATLTISDGVCSLSLQDTVRTVSTTAAITIPTPLCAKTDAPFTAATSSPDLTYLWDFGDGFISNLQNPVHEYQNAGNYTVQLTVTSVNGCTSVQSKQVAVTPELTANIGVNKQICAGDSALLTAPSGFTAYQWYKDGNAMGGATQQNYSATKPGTYWVKVSNGDGCVALSNQVVVSFHAVTVAKIYTANKIVCTNALPFYVNANYGNNYQYQWSITGPAAGIITPANSYYATIDIPSKTVGNYELILQVTDSQTGCVATDTLCLTVEQSPTLAVQAPSGNLCEGNVYTFVAKATPSVSPQNYIYSWSTGHVGDTLRTGKPGMVSVTAVSPGGCAVTQFAGMIKALPDVSLFPVGCDTLCLTDTIYFPLPKPMPGGYTVNWYDDSGTSVTPVGSGQFLLLSNLHPGIHHLYATVSYPGSCEATSRKYNIYVKDCSLQAACDYCEVLFESAKIEQIKLLESGTNANILNYNLTLSISKEIKELRLALSDFIYHWSDTVCVNCKLPALQRGCLFPASGNTDIGSLKWVDYTSSGAAVAAAAPDCPGELIWKGNSPLMPGTYTIPLKLTVPKPLSDSCKLIVDKACFHLTLIDTLCHSCEKMVCAEGVVSYNPPGGDPENPTDVDSCKCNYSGEWNSLYLIAQQPGIPRPRTQILCNTTLTGYLANVNYVLSGVYHCQGECVSVKNEIVVYDQVQQIIYTHQSANLNEVLNFPAPGIYTVVLTASCGDKKCVCMFKVNVKGEGAPPSTDTETEQEPPVVVPEPPVVGGIPTIDLPHKIDSIVKAIIPKDFNGGVLVAKNDTVLYEKYISYKDEVNAKTSFDIASITKTFTAAAVLRLMEAGSVKLDDPVKNYLPKFPFNDITVRNLLTHRSGLMDYLKFLDGVGWDKSVQVTNKDLLDIIVDNKSKVIINKPGAAYSYSNTNFALLALIIESVSGSSYANYLSKEFFEPLGMKDSYVLNVNNFAKATRSYYRNGTQYKLRYLDLIYGDKCIYSSPQDLRRWDSGLRAGKVLEKSTIEQASRTIGAPVLFNSTYVMGWKKLTASNGKAFLYHDGWWAGNRALLIRLVDEDVVIAVLSNNNFTTIKEIRKLVDLFGDYRISGKNISNF